MASLHCENCGIGDNGFNLEGHLMDAAILCTACLKKVIRQWKKRPVNLLKREKYAIDFMAFREQMRAEKIIVNATREYSKVVVKSDTADYGLANVDSEKDMYSSEPTYTLILELGKKLN